MFPSSSDEPSDIDSIFQSFNFDALEGNIDFFETSINGQLHQDGSNMKGMYNIFMANYSKQIYIGKQTT